MSFNVSKMEKIYNKICVKCGKNFLDRGVSPFGLCDECRCDNQYDVKVMANWVVEQNIYFRIIKENLANRKTPIYHIETLDGVPLGEIKWYGAWRKFCFFPYEETVWDMKCLTDIIKFLDKTNKEWREKK